MDTQALPQEQWGAFFDELSRQYNGGQVSATASGDGMSDAPIFTGLPLLGIQLDIKGSDAGSITVIAARDADTSISHTIPGPTQVHVARDGGGSVSMIQIDAPDPAQTKVYFQSAS